MQLPIPDDWDGDSFCTWAVCWPNSVKWKAALYGLLEMPSQGRFWDFQTGNFIALRAAFRPAYDANFELSGVIMTCESSEALTNALNAIAAALNANSGGSGVNSGCCEGGSRGGGSTPSEPSGVDIEGSDPATDEPPTGYDSWEQFNQQRCGVATQIIQEVQTSLGNMTLISIGGISLAGLIELLIVGVTLTVSTAGIAAIAALILTIGATIICATALSLVNDHFDELVCALLSGTSSATSRAAFIAKWNEIVDAAAIDPVEGFAIKQLMAYMVGNEETNKLYTPNASIDYSSYECTECVEDCTDFNDGQLHGYTVANDCCVFFYPFAVYGTISPALNAAKCSTQEAAGIHYASILSPVFPDRVIETGDFICVHVSDDTTIGTVNNYLEGLIDGVWTDLGHITGNPVGTSVVSLNAFVGQTITRFQIGWTANVSFDLYVTTTGLNCNNCT